MRKLELPEAKCLTLQRFLKARSNLAPSPPESHTWNKSSDTKILLLHG